MKPERKKQQLLTIPNQKWHWYLLLAVVVLGFAVKLIRIETPKDFYFDEVYHAWTATRYLHNDPEVYNPWTKSAPSGMGMEWTHPPLSKLMMAGTMKIFGENAFGWRIGSVLTGTLAIALASALAYLLFGSSLTSLLTGYLLTLEGLMFAQSRIAMNDTYFLFFMLLTLIAYVRWKSSPKAWAPLVLTGIGLGLAIGTKWTGLYLGMVLAIDLARGFFKKKPLEVSPSVLQIALCLGLIPAIAYLLCYLQFFLQGGGFSAFVKLQQTMWAYHSGLKATHSYQSVPWQWLLNLRPVWMYVNYPGEGKIANIYNLGNSVILLAGLFAVYRSLFHEKIKTWARWFVLLCYFMFWVPWIFSPRIMLFYHYLPAVVFLCILLARWLHLSLASPKASSRRVAYVLLSGAFVWFALFYPHQTALTVPQSLAHRLYFLIPSWK